MLICLVDAAVAGAGKQPLRRRVRRPKAKPITMRLCGRWHCASNKGQSASGLPFSQLHVSRLLVVT